MSGIFKILAVAALVCAIPPVAQAAAQTAQNVQSEQPARFAWFDYSGNDAPARTPIAATQYRNPILEGFYPDPSIVRVGQDYYLANSTFSYFPGIPIFHSRDLVHWTQIGNAIDRPGMLNFDGIHLSAGVFAPALSWYAGTFYLIDACVDCGGTFIVTAKNPAGPWSNPVWIKDVGGIDPSLFIDDDGSAWLVNNDVPEGKPLYDGHRALWIRPFDLATLKTSGPAHMIVNGGIDPAKKPVWTEGPHIFKRAGRYYLIAAEGGTGINHSETVYVADRPDGPYTAYPKPILTQRDLPADRPDPITSTGHASLVVTQTGQWWAVFLGTRPYRDDLYNTGRETFLLPVHWQDGWPIILAPGKTVPTVETRPDLPPQPDAPIPMSGNFTVHAAFTGTHLAPYWMTPRVPKSDWYRLDGAALEITPRLARLGEATQPSFIARRQQNMNMTATTRMRFAAARNGDKAGLAAYQNEAHYYFIGVVNDGGQRLLRVERRADANDPVDGVVLASTALTTRGPVDLRIAAQGGRYTFSYAVGGEWKTLLADADGTILSTEKAGGFVGTLIGLYAHAGQP
jgi:alpha-N-arabinofuranosidase